MPLSWQPTSGSLRFGRTPCGLLQGLTPKGWVLACQQHSPTRTVAVFFPVPAHAPSLCTDSAAAYHKHVVQLGLLQLVPQLAALCPDADKRAALVAAHKRYLESAQDNLQSPAAGNSKGWVPPEAAMAALAEVEQQGSWACERCTLVNAPSSRMCEVCSAPKPKAGAAAAAGGSSGGSSKKAAAVSSAARAAPAEPVASSSTWSAAAAPSGSSGGSSRGTQQQAESPPPPQQHQAPPPAESWPGLPGGKGKKGGSKAAASQAAQREQQASSSSAAASSSPLPEQAGGKKGKKGGSKQPLSELLATGQSHPQNAWSQQQRLSQLAAPSGGRGSMGQWGKSGGSKLAKSIGAFNDAWGDKK